MPKILSPRKPGIKVYIVGEAKGRPQNFAKSPPYFCPTYVVPVKSKVEISQNFVTFSEYMNFKNKQTKSFQFLLTFRTKIRCLSRRLSALPCNNSHHTFLLQSKTRLRESNIQQDNFHFYIDFSYSDEIHYHIPIWIVLDYYSRDRGCHKIPGSNKQNLMSTQLNLSIMIF